MKVYTEKETLRIAKRFHNTKRTYLLVNPLQAKHLPVSATAALDMMGALGEKLAQKYPTTRLVIGFAETATAIGAAVAACFGPDCVYLHTTRESMTEIERWILFQEEHSHAVEQKLADEHLCKWLEASDTIVFVDDEISTGKTLINIIDQLRKRYAFLSEKRMVAASLLNRLSPAHERRMAENGVESEYLVKLPQEDYAARVADICIHEAASAVPQKLCLQAKRLPCDRLLNPRKGMRIGDYQASCRAAANAFLAEYSAENRGAVLVLGTEECMYPALVLAQMLERRYPDCRVRCHATTRSPIGISDDAGYPISRGSKIRSFYEAARDSYIYAPDYYDAMIVVSDAPEADLHAMEVLFGAMPDPKPKRLYFLNGSNRLWQSE